MKLLQAAFLAVLVVCVAAQYAAPRAKPKVPEIDQTCLDCICQASSDCDLSKKCHNSGDGGYFCGPYVISWAYWADAGKPGNRGGAHDFETCLNDKKCAEQTVQAYMRKHGQDCDRNGVIDCDDFARIHKLGYGQCSGEAIYHTDYWEKFEACYGGYGNENLASNYGNNENIPANNGNDGNIPSNYGNDGNIPNNYGNDDNSPGHYGNEGNVAIPYDYGDGQLQARKADNKPRNPYEK